MAFLLSQISCNNIVNSGISEGEIVFNIEYLDSERKNPLIALLPKKMHTAFKDNSSYSLIEGYFGTFKIINIVNYKKKKAYSLFQILDKKYVYETDINNEAFGYSSMGTSNINFIDEQKIVAGYVCGKATVIFNNSINNYSDTIDVFYTNDIKIENPNSNNPYSKIKGVLMEFTVNMTDINMKFTAEKVNSKNISQSIFNIPKGYKSVSKKELEKIIKKFNNSKNN